MTPLTKHTTMISGGRGGATCSPSGDGGAAIDANVCSPNRLAVDQTGNLYLTDRGSVREITKDGLIRTVFGIFGGSAFAISLDVDGSLYISEADTSGSHYPDSSRIRKMTPNGVITTIAATTISGYSGDGGPAKAARLSSPGPIAVDAEGNLYIADDGNLRVRKVLTA
jgi:hypothetical protein